jgi:hypothetical protein
LKETISIYESKIAYTVAEKMAKRLNKVAHFVFLCGNFRLMAKIRISKQFDFEAAHALEGYHGKCKDIHGHSYHLRMLRCMGEVSFVGTGR